MCLWALLPFFISACDGDEEYLYPDLITEFVDVLTDSEGRMNRMVTDEGRLYYLTREFEGYVENSRYRTRCGYALEGGYARIYRLESVRMLVAHDEGVSDPLGLESIWRGGEYLNLVLLPKTQGASHSYGYRVDSVVSCGVGSTQRYYLTLLHEQGGDPTSYTQRVNASILLAGVGGLSVGDSLDVRVNTFSGFQRWSFVY